MRLSYFVFALGLIAFSANAISFYVAEGQEKCFSDEIPSRSVIIVYHELQSGPTVEKKKVERKNQAEQDKLITDGLEFRVYDPSETKIETHTVKPGPNKFSFTSGQMGRYKFCIYKAKTFWKSVEYKYFLKIQQGVDFQLQDAANKTHVQTLQDRIDGLTNRTKDFINLQQLNREQEDKLTMQSVLINQRVVETTIIQIVVLVASGLYQIWSLRKFFKQRFLL